MLETSLQTPTCKVFFKRLEPWHGDLLRLFCMVLAALTLWHCPADSSAGADQLAKDFMQAYYVQAQLQKALDCAEGLAAVKIKGQLELGGGQATDQALSERRVNFARREPSNAALESERVARREFFYDLQISLGSQTPMQRIVRLTLEKMQAPSNASGAASAARWKVVNFVEVQ